MTAPIINMSAELKIKPQALLIQFWTVLDRNRRQQVDRRRIERAGEFFHHGQGRIALAPLQLANIGVGHVDLIRERLD